MDKAIEEIKEIFAKFGLRCDIFNIADFDLCKDDEKLNKDLSDFLKRFEENMIESNAEELRNQELNAENLEPMFDKNDLD